MKKQSEFEVLTGIVIPKNKKNLFLNKFERALLECYKIQPVFVRKTKNVCEVKFRQLKTKVLPKNYLQQKMSAKDFVLRHLPSVVQDVKKNLRKAKQTKSSKPEVVVIDEEENIAPSYKPWRLPSVIDLTRNSTDHTEPEVIVLDETPDQVKRSVERLGSRSDTNPTNQGTLQGCPMRKRKRTGSSDIEIIGVKNNSKGPLLSLTPLNALSTNNKVRSLLLNSLNLTTIQTNNCSCPSPVKANPPMCKRGNKGGRKRSFSQSFQDSVVTETVTNQSVQQKKKKKKLDLSSTRSQTSPKIKQLSGGVCKYYENINKAINKVKVNQRVANNNRNFPLYKSKGFTQLKASPLVPRKRNSPFQSPKRSRKRLSIKNLKQQRTNPSSKHLKKRASITSTTYNPNPVIVEVEGKRPIAIDANNVAKGHGRGTFSPRGLKICVDYFVQRGYAKDKVKVFMPQCDQQHFSKQLLEELEQKCNIVFTPSRVIGGRLIKSYDDRFIVEYAEEFGAIIVSNDNYRDLIKEKPQLESGIIRRLLQFSWVDDFLMFPLDPLGRGGPSLDEFLKF